MERKYTPTSGHSHRINSHAPNIRRGHSLDEDSTRSEHYLPIPPARVDMDSEIRRLPKKITRASSNRIAYARSSHSFDNICDNYNSKDCISDDLVQATTTTTGQAFYTTSGKNESEINSNSSLQLKKIPEESRRNILIEQLAQNTYECMVCYEKIVRHDPIWHCPKCYNIFHLTCIHKWAVSSLLESDDVYDGSDNIGKRWRCPGCQTHNDLVPDRSLCFCGTVEFPETLDDEVLNNNTPHSCGQLCGRIKADSSCTHPCLIPCHPGPCPLCLIEAPRSCSCGRVTFMITCSSKNILMCKNICQKLLSCGIHRCSQVCHPKSCPKCAFSITLECHCGKDSKDVPCSFLRTHQIKYSCGKPCDKSVENPCRSLCHAGKCIRAQGGYWRRARIIPDEKEEEIRMLCWIFVIILACCVGLYALFVTLQIRQL